MHNNHFSEKRKKANKHLSTKSIIINIAVYFATKTFASLKINTELQESQTMFFSRSVYIKIYYHYLL